MSTNSVPSSRRYGSHLYALRAYRPRLAFESRAGISRVSRASTQRQTPDHCGARLAISRLLQLTISVVLYVGARSCLIKSTDLTARSAQPPASSNVRKCSGAGTWLPCWRLCAEAGGYSTVVRVRLAALSTSILSASSAAPWMRCHAVLLGPRPNRAECETTMPSEDDMCKDLPSFRVCHTRYRTESATHQKTIRAMKQGTSPATLRCAIHLGLFCRRTPRRTAV